MPAGWPRSPGLMTSKIRVLPARAPVPGACRWRCEAVGGRPVRRHTHAAGRCRPSAFHARRVSYSRPRESTYPPEDFFTPGSALSLTNKDCFVSPEIFI